MTLLTSNSNAILYEATSNLIDSQLPGFIVANNPNFDAFLKAYYRWMEQANSGAVLYHTKNLLNYKDIDKTTDEFIQYFINDFLPNFPPEIALNEAKMIKTARQFYSTKGSEESVKFLFRVLYEKDVEVYYPKDNILKASDGKWQIPQSLRLVLSPEYYNFDLILLNSREAHGSNSYATCTIESAVTTLDVDLGIDIVELYVSNIVGNFNPKDNIVVSGTYPSNNQPFVFSEQIISSISEIAINPKYQGNEYIGKTYDSFGNLIYPGDPVVFFGGASSSNFKIANAFVNVVDTLGRIESFWIDNRGFNYTSTPNVSVRVADIQTSLTGTQISQLEPPLTDNVIFYQGSSFSSKTFSANLAYSGSTVTSDLAKDGKLRIYDYNGSIDINQPLSIVGSSVTISITEPPFYYGNGQAKANAIFLNGLIQYPGYYLNTDGQPSADQYLQDSLKYHNYSYVVQVEKSLYDYKQTLMNIIHPSGMKMLAEYSILDQKPIDIQIDSSFAVIPPNNLGKITTNAFSSVATVIGTYPGDYNPTNFEEIAQANDLIVIDYSNPARIQTKLITQVVSNTELIMESNTMFMGNGTISIQAFSNVATLSQNNYGTIEVGDILGFVIGPEDDFVFYDTAGTSNTAYFIDRNNNKVPSGGTSPSGWNPSDILVINDNIGGELYFNNGYFTAMATVTEAEYGTNKLKISLPDAPFIPSKTRNNLTYFVYPSFSNTHYQIVRLQDPLGYEHEETIEFLNSGGTPLQIGVYAASPSTNNWIALNGWTGNGLGNGFSIVFPAAQTAAAGYSNVAIVFSVLCSSGQTTACTSFSPITVTYGNCTGQANVTLIPYNSTGVYWSSLVGVISLTGYNPSSNDVLSFQAADGDYVSLGVLDYFDGAGNPNTSGQQPGLQALVVYNSSNNITVTPIPGSYFPGATDLSYASNVTISVPAGGIGIGGTFLNVTSGIPSVNLLNSYSTSLVWPQDVLTGGPSGSGTSVYGYETAAGAETQNWEAAAIVGSGGGNISYPNQGVYGFAASIAPAPSSSSEQTINVINNVNNLINLISEY
jgi:hypothetical protein